MLTSSKVDMNRNKNDVAFRRTGFASPGKQKSTQFSKRTRLPSKSDTGVRATSLIRIQLVPIGKFCTMFVQVNSTTFLHTISEATMGLKASQLLAIDMVKGVCGDGGEVLITESDCFKIDGKIDDETHESYCMQDDNNNKRKTRRAHIALTYMFGQRIKQKRDILLESERERNRPRKKTRISRPRRYTDPITRARRKKTPKMSAWWEDYIDDPQPGNQHWAKEFRQNFCLPYASYAIILDMILSNQSEGLFDRWKTNSNCYESENNKKNKKVSPIELFFLGSLRYLGRRWTFNDMRDVTYVSRDVHRKKFVHQFVRFGATMLYPISISAPRIVEELMDCEQEYNNAGFPGCIGSTDATHIPLEKICFLCAKRTLG
jgi:hypothetical protein